MKRLNQNERARLLSHVEASLSMGLGAWYDRERLALVAHRELERQLDITQDLAAATRFYESMNLAETRPEDFLQRCHALGGGEVILTGIRFKGMNIEMPFVDLVAASFELSDGQRLAETLKVIERDYNALKPKWIRIMQWRGEGVSWPTDSAVTPDIAYLASPTSKLKALPPPQGCEILEVRRCQDLDFYPVYRREHDAFRAASSFGQDVPISTREDLARCLEEGLLYEARVEGSWAGLIAAAAESFYGISALCIHEEILCEPLRGKGLGPALQRKMIDAVDKDILIYGTIDARNLASLKTAKRVGREQVAQRLFCTLSTARSALD